VTVYIMFSFVPAEYWETRSSRYTEVIVGLSHGFANPDDTVALFQPVNIII